MGIHHNPNDARVIYIGGASAAGKSTAAEMLSTQTGRPVFDLDKILHQVEKHADTSEEQGDFTRILARTFIEEMLTTKTRCIVEGVWIQPAISAELLDQYGRNYFPIYCGYPNANAEERLQTIADNGTHWLAMRPKPEATAFIQDKIEKQSTQIRAEANKYGLNFIDFSTQSQGCEDLLQLFT